MNKQSINKYAINTKALNAELNRLAANPTENGADVFARVAFNSGLAPIETCTRCGGQTFGVFPAPSGMKRRCRTCGQATPKPAQNEAAVTGGAR